MQLIPAATTSSFIFTGLGYSECRDIMSNQLTIGIHTTVISNWACFGEVQCSIPKQNLTPGAVCSLVGNKVSSSSEDDAPTCKTSCRYRKCWTLPP